MSISSTNPLKSQLGALEVFHLVETKTLDIRRAGSFVVTASPQPTTGLLLVGLPAGFLLLGLIREKQKPNCRLKYVAILGTILTVGILSHDEFYLFVIIASLLPLIYYRLSETKNSVYVSLLCSLFIVIFADIMSPVQSYTTRQILGIPLIALVCPVL